MLRSKAQLSGSLCYDFFWIAHLQREQQTHRRNTRRVMQPPPYGVPPPPPGHYAPPGHAYGDLLAVIAAVDSMLYRCEHLRVRSLRAARASRQPDCRLLCRSRPDVIHCTKALETVWQLVLEGYGQHDYYRQQSAYGHERHVEYGSGFNDGESRPRDHGASDSSTTRYSAVDSLASLCTGCS